MHLPIWSTVIISRFASGFVVGFLVVALFAGGTFSATTSGGISAGSELRFAAGMTLASMVVTGLVTFLLLPRLSGVTVGVGNVMLATLAGQLLPLIGMLLALQALAHSSAAASPYLLVYGGMSPFLALGLNIGGIALTAWMLSTSSVSGGRHNAARYDLYNRAYRETLDDDAR